MYVPQEFKYYIFPDMYDYTKIDFSTSAKIPTKLESGLSYAVIVGPIDSNYNYEETEISVLFTKYKHSFEWPWVN
ncbi:hypothetical protein J2T56_002779 [Natronobacillus azotifigens]|uniref:Uncharacterized protein n=1 Tax=Natronobacillus azotifigens TaxID=472978 RepID=A0A9J6RG72_9BACI|nr:hypothetical protein [Natronobacillus azotifigens]MCZ0704405.1 hypothetical protein [Natronobacillus azotifigens]